jgi:hypothetical protein
MSKGQKTKFVKSAKGTLIGFLNEGKTSNDEDYISVAFHKDMISIIKDEGDEAIITLLNKIASIEVADEKKSVKSSKDV